MKRFLLLSALLLSALLPAAARSRVKALPTCGDRQIRIFDKAAVQFLPDSLGNYTPADGDGIIHIANGRILLKKIQLPDYRRNLSLKLTVRVESAGDRWDKSGSVFVIPDGGAGINLLSIAKGKQRFPPVDPQRHEKLIGTVPGPDYLPTVELMRFMTPFGVGYYSRRDTAAFSRTRPVYIDGWAEESCWEADVTELYPLLKGEAYVGIFIDTWTGEGYLASVDLEVQESRNAYDPLPERHVEPLLNTVYYMGQEYPDIFARQPLSVDFPLPRPVRNARLKYIVTGHGGHSGGDEFTRQRNILSVDGERVLDFIPWRTDCAAFRRFNPSSGIWAVRREASFYGREGREIREIDEMIASSDLSRSNWCPGSQVHPVSVPLGALSAGTHRFTVDIPDAQPIEGDKMNHWLVSAYLVWED